MEESIVVLLKQFSYGYSVHRNGSSSLLLSNLPNILLCSHVWRWDYTIRKLCFYTSPNIYGKYKTQKAVSTTLAPSNSGWICINTK